jgi:Fe-S cluster assembly ATP-binding protein
MNLEIKKLSLKKDSKYLLRNISLTVPAGTVHAIIGPNGAGKSTLAYLIMGLDGYRDFNGQLTFNGLNLAKLPVHKRAQAGIALAWQEPARFEGITVEQYLEISAQNKPLDKEKILVQVGLDPEQYLSRKLDKNLSGGERKRIELASLIAMQPKLVILDEPDSGIDIEARQMLFDVIKRWREQGAIMLLITHSVQFLKQADTASLLCNGEIIESGQADEVENYFLNKCLKCDHKNEPDKR